jgi:antitoxin Phd
MRSLPPPSSSSARFASSSATLSWKLEDAKARFSEVVRMAGTAGPQLVTVRGKEAAVILAPEQYRQLLPRTKGSLSLVRFLRSLDLSLLDVEREHDSGREVDL